MVTRLRFAFALSGLIATLPASAVRVQDVRINGIADPGQLHNAQRVLSLWRDGAAKGDDIGEERLAFLLRKAPQEIRTALEPYGYYDTQVVADVQRAGDAATVVFAVTLGEPVKVVSRAAAMTGPAHDDAVVQRGLVKLGPMTGQVLDHRVYEASKANVANILVARGYFDAKLTQRRVEVTRATHAAAIDVAWDSGVRYHYASTAFSPNQFRPGLIDPMVPWKAGQPYDQARLLALQQSLVDLDYFSVIDVIPDLEHKADGVVPVIVNTTPAKRNVYSAGLSYGTDSGAGVQLGFNRRWLNRRGHKLSAQFEWAQKLKLATAQYQIPVFGGLGGWYALTTSATDEITDAGHTRLIEIIGSRSAKWHGWTLTAAMHAQRERYQDALFPDFDRYATLVFPALSAQIAHGDDKLYPTRGWGLDTELRGGSTAFGSDASFAQLRVKANFVHSFTWNNRLLLRAELGHTVSGDFDTLSPSLRFYAGGDDSVRGYGYQEIGPQVDGRNVGARNLAVFSVEGEHRFTQTWGAAAFVDEGDAFNDSPQSHVGIGVGLRWRSPVGPVRVDIAHGLNDPRSPVRLHLNIGADL